MADYFSEMGWRELRDGERPLFHIEWGRLFGIFGGEDKIPPPASKEAVESLEDATVTQTGTQCPVCLKEYTTGELTKKMPCNHEFHPGCLLLWLQKTNSCPLCRFELPTDDEEYEAERKEKIRAKERVHDLENLHNSMFS
ncbi:E3 ubiquitin-protein ligase RNF181 [Anthonomus grandis grandis]|uniref:E3 ubiquitin-protein ligase RNF181 n=1 Tax=Anthonomus grandis grandis TaxID=2921223 RepID=UPI0021651947|nr:E3 ubiquitin-protein ligase RNF181 [Anthonomus grandis grandis]